MELRRKKTIHPEKKVVVNIGDGGLLMSLGELSTVAALNLDITVIVWRDNEYGMIRWHQQKNSLSTFGVSLYMPNISKLAESFGGKGYEVTSSKKLLSVLKKSTSRSGLSVVDCPVDYSDNLRVFSSQHTVEFPHYVTQ